MALLRRQGVTQVIYDDQDPVIWNSYVGDWDHTSEASQQYNWTVTIASAPGPFLSFSFSGTQALLYGALSNSTTVEGEFVSYPTADYMVDGITMNPKPRLDNQRRIVYFETPLLADGAHHISLTVTNASGSNQFIIDYFLTILTAGGSTSVSTSASTSVIGTSRSSTASPAATSSDPPVVVTHATPVGAIVGGAVGGAVGVVVLVVAVWFCLRRRSHGRARNYKISSPADTLTGEGHVEPFNATAITPAHPSSPLSQPGQPDFYDTAGVTQTPGNTAQRRIRKATPVVQNVQQSVQQQPVQQQSVQQPVQQQPVQQYEQQEPVQQPVRHGGSETRLGENEEQIAGPSQLPNEAPPSYTP